MKDIAGARESIHLEYFHFGNDRGGREVMEALGKKAREGVEVRFLNENIADFPIPSSYYNKMKMTKTTRTRERPMSKQPLSRKLEKI